ncbi:MAG TPA: glycine cleavage system aminomethyltransferase GcvT [Thermomicrobiales bacterium]|nr:glycine cleavage system aminomethyltransferase GcvT [Thermomicrobiales bacterium]
MTDEHATPLKRTALYERHKELGARLIPFAGWEMPVQYAGIIAEHRAVRNEAGLFDLGHMGQFLVTGPDALAFLQYTTTNDLSDLEPGQAKYTLLSNENGGVIDDLIVYRNPEGEDGYTVVMNASNAPRDVAWWEDIRVRRDDLDVTLDDMSDRTGMIAIQGPRSQAIVQKLTDESLDDLAYFTWRNATVAGVATKIARTGYTGEDGFEFYAPNENIDRLWSALMDTGQDEGLVPVGLGARDTLRLEARMPLYGQELGDEISPYEAGLGWAVKLDKGEFIGREQMAAVKEQGAERKAVGFKLTGRGGAPRTHYPVQVDGEIVGEVTSGAMSPTLQENIGLALIRKSAAGVGKPLEIIVRGKSVDAVQVKTPFYKRPS